MYCSKCKRNVAKGGDLRHFKELSPMQRAASLKARKKWLNDFTKVHKELIRERH